jgi:peptide/nickel transport system substrate-binding protein
MIRPARKAIVHVFIWLLAVMLIAVGCSSGSSKSTGQSSGGSSKPQYGGTLRLAVNGDANSLGDITVMRSLYDMMLSAPAVQTLVQADKDGEMEHILAESMTPDPDKNEITIKLKQGIRFHDDTPFNAEALKWILEYYNSARPEISSMDTATVVDEYTLLLKLKQWDSTMMEALASIPIVSPTATQKNGKEWIDKNPVGTGPFKFVKWEKNIGVSYVKNENYWEEGKPYLDAIEITIVADKLAGSMSFQNKEFDIYTAFEPQLVNSLKEHGQVVTLPDGLGGSAASIMFNSKDADSPFADLRVRQAVAHAIDVKAIVDSQFFGYAQASPQWGLPGAWFYNPDIKGYPYDPEKAKQLLREAGYPNGFTTNLWHLPNQDQMNFYAAVQGYLKEVGIDVKLQPVETGKYRELQSQGWDGMLHAALRGDGLGVFMPPAYVPGGFYSASLNVPPRLFDLFTELKAAKTTEDKKRIAYEIQSLVFHDELITLHLYVTKEPVLKAFNVHGDEINIRSQTPYWKPQNAWIEQ